MIKKGRKYQKNKILDYYQYELPNVMDAEKKNQKRTMNSIIRNQNRMHIFHYLPRHEGKGVRRNIKKLLIKGENGEVTKSYLYKSSIE